MSSTFREATAVSAISSSELSAEPAEPQERQLFAAEVPDHWQQGRGAFGGLVFGLLVRAARAAEPDRARVLRTFSSDVAGPVLPGPARLAVRVLRRGKSQTNMQVELEQGGQVAALANLTFSLERALEAPTPMPTPPAEALTDWSKLVPIAIAPPMGPVFAQHYEYRNVGNLGPLFGGVAKEAVSAGFLRESAWQTDPDGRLDAAALTALLDAYWPALFALSPRPLLMTTVSFNAQYTNHALPLLRSQPLFLRARALTQNEGYSLEFRELWAGDKLVALNQQTFAILK